MSKFERGYHPLSSVESLETPRVAMKLNLPDYVNTDKIGVNVRGMHRMMKLGGINSLSVTGTSGERSSVTPVVVGSDGGSALGAFVGKEVVVATFNTKSRRANPGRYIPAQAEWIDVDLKVNLDEITQRIENRKKRLRDVNAWAHQLNNAISDGIASIGSRHVIGNYDLFQKATSVSLYGTTEMFGIAGSVAAHQPIAGNAIGSYFLGTLVGNVTTRNIYQKSRDQDDQNGFRWSLVYGPQVDRAVLLHGLAKSTRVVKELK
jgi:hypothetical protein